MKITLVSPRLALQKGDFLGSGVPYWPLELAVFASFLRDSGESVRVLDLFGAGTGRLESRPDHYLQGLPLSERLGDGAISEAECFILFAISAMSHAELLDISRTLRQERPGAPILVFENSQAVTAYAIDDRAGEFFESGATALLCGEPYWNWTEIKGFISSGRSAGLPANMSAPGVRRAVRRASRKGGSYPRPAWDLFDLEAYWALPYSHGPKTARFFPILTSRGCPYPCDFCVVPATSALRWSGRDPAEVVDEMIALRDRFGVNDFQIEDLNPTVSAPRLDAICRLLIERRADIRFYIVSGTKAETLGVDQIGLLARAGCRYLSISPESGSARVLKAMGKPFDHRHGVALVRECRRRGIRTQACFLSGHPAETRADHELSIEYLRELVREGLDEAAVFIVAPLPGSGLARAGRVALRDESLLLSFSPRGRSDWVEASARRGELIKSFFLEKAKKGLPLLLQGLRALFKRPRTKMENVPWRLLHLYGLIARNR